MPGNESGKKSYPYWLQVIIEFATVLAIIFTSSLSFYYLDVVRPGYALWSNDIVGQIWAISLRLAFWFALVGYGTVLHVYRKYVAPHIYAHALGTGELSLPGLAVIHSFVISVFLIAFAHLKPLIQTLNPSYGPGNIEIWFERYNYQETLIIFAILTTLAIVLLLIFKQSFRHRAFLPIFLIVFAFSFSFANQKERFDSVANKARQINILGNDSMVPQDTREKEERELANKAVELARTLEEKEYSNYLLAWTLFDQGRYEESKAATLKAMSYINKSWLNGQLGYTEIKLGNYEEALRVSKICVAGLPDYPTVSPEGCYGPLIQAYEALGNEQGIKDAVDDFLKKYPNSSRAQTWKKEISEQMGAW